MFEVPAGAKGWLIVFHRRSTWWVERICPGRFKHVSAVGFVPEANAWLALSWELGRMRALVVPDDKFLGWFGGWCGEDAGVLRMAAPEFDLGSWRPRVGLFCCSMVAHLLGLRGGALLPGGLWRLLLANGAELVTDGQPLRSQSSGREADGPGDHGVGECQQRPA